MRYLIFLLMIIFTSTIQAQGMGDIGHTTTTVTKNTPSSTLTYPNTKFNYNKIDDTTEAIGREIYDNAGSFLSPLTITLSIAPHIFYSGNSTPTDGISVVDLIIEQKNTGEDAQSPAIYSGTGPIRMLVDDSIRIAYTANHITDRLYTGGIIGADMQSKSFWIVVLTSEQFNQLARSHKIDVDFQGNKFTLKNADTSWAGIVRLISK